MMRTIRRRAVRQRLAAKPLAAGVATLSLLGATGAVAAAAITGGFGTGQVGTDDGTGILLADNQKITPAGSRYQVSDGRLLSSALSPDGTKLATLTWKDFQGFVTIIDLKSGTVIQQVGTGTSADPTLGDGTVAADGPFYTPDGSTLYVPQTSDIVKFAVTPTGELGSSTVIPLPSATLPGNTSSAALPSGMALSADGTKLYVALNGANTLGVINTSNDALVSQIPVGNAPRQVAVMGNKAYVSNEGGRPATSADFTNLSDNTPVVADPSTGAATTGSVSVVDLGSDQQIDAIPVGLEPTAEFVAPDGTLLVANSNNDSMSLINTRTDKVAQTVNVNPLPGSTVGSYPNAITMPDAHHILVSIGRDNAIAVYDYNGATNPAQYTGLIPTDWYPVAVQADPALNGQLVVTNDKGIGARGPLSTINKGPGTNPATGHNTYDDTGTVTVFGMPNSSQLGTYTHQVFVDNDWEHLLSEQSGSAGDAAPAVIPAKLGDPSRIKHVFLIVKENRTYDQVLGDIGKGNSDPALAQFGSQVTPNQHALANTYNLFDNFYDPGTLSADGHNWLVQADANDYIEKEFGAFFRSYPAQGGDALAYQRNGFIWNAAARAGKTSAAFGEYANFFTAPAPSQGGPTWQQWYKDSQIMEGKASGTMPVPENAYKTYADIPSLNAILDPYYPRFDLDVPDQYRVDVWNQAFTAAEQSGNLANLNLLWVPDDHTSGLNSGDPYPTAQVADNDLAVGRIIDRISHSKFWDSSAVFVVEDDPQNGVDHVDGHRSTLFVASPYSKRGAIDSTYYSQINVVRTIEQILGIQPMNQVDRAAEPMFDAFTDNPDFTPFDTLPNQVPLTLGTTPSSSATTPAGAAQAPANSAGPATPGGAGWLEPVVPAKVMGIYDAWQAWSSHQGFSRQEDLASPAQLNRLDWYAATGWSRPYPGDKAILAPNQVPGAKLPADYLGDG